jgi:hypothetical protein
MTYHTYMKKVKATHTVTRSAARFGVPDPAEACDLLANSVPLKALAEAEAILDLGQGCCGISRAIVKRLQNQAYIDHFDAIFKVHGIDNDLALVKKAQRLGFVNSVHSDVEEFTPDTKYKVIIGNPPYQAPKNENGAKNAYPFWRRFLKKAEDLVEDGGYVSLLVPSQVAKFHEEGKPSPALQKVPTLGVVSIQTGMEVYFNVGSEISLITLQKGAQKDFIQLNGQTWNWGERPWVPTNTSPENLSLLEKLFEQKGRIRFIPQYHRDEWIVDVTRSIGCWGMNRGHDYGLKDLSQITKERTVHMMVTEFDTRDEQQSALHLFNSPVYRFLKSMLMFGSDVSFKTLSALPIPEGWQNLTSPEEVADLFGLTEEEKALLS